MRRLGLVTGVVDLVGREHHGLRLRRSTVTTASSTSWMPTVASTTNSTASAAAMASSACSAIWAASPLASEAQPPVSTMTNCRPFQIAS